MDETPKFGLPLLQPAQAQKHVSVNEALVRLDGLAQLVLASVSRPVPPGVPREGDCFGVPVGAGAQWAGQDGQVALFSNGGWIFIPPAFGWKAWVADLSANAIFDGSDWVVGALAVSSNGAGTIQEVIEIDHAVVAGSSSVVPEGIPGGAIVIGITGRVLQGLGAGLSGWSLGVVGSADRYGSGLGFSQGDWLRGFTGSPLTYYQPEDLVLTAEGGTFSGGSVCFALHLVRLTLPRP